MLANVLSNDAQSTIDDDAVIGAIAARIERFHTFAAEYTQREETLITSESRTYDLGGGTTGFVSNATREKQCRLIIVGRNVRYATQITEEFLDRLGPDGGIGEPAMQLRVITEEREQRLIQVAPDRSPYGSISAPDDPLPRMIVDVALGLRLARTQPGWIEPENVRNAEMRVVKDGRIVIEHRRESGAVDRWLYNLHEGLALLRYSLQLPNSDFDALVIENTDFHNVDGVMLPFRIKKTRYANVKGEVRKTHLTEITIDSYQFIIDDVGDAIMSIAWPAGTRVYDHIRGGMFEAGANGALLPVNRSHRSQSQLQSYRSGNDSLMLHQRAPARTNLGWTTIAVGIALGLLAAAMPRSGRHDRGISATALVWFGLAVSGSAVPYAQAIDDSPAGERPDPETLYMKRHIEGAATIMAYHQDADRRIIARAAHDLDLSRSQAFVFNQSLSRYRAVLKSAREEFANAHSAWRRSYWAERMPLLVDEQADISHLSPQEQVQLASYRYVYSTGRDPILDDAFRNALDFAHGPMYVEFEARRRSAEEAMFEGMAAALNEPQRADWERAKRRIQIALHDACRPSDGLPTGCVDMLGLFEEASHEGEEFACLAPVFCAISIEHIADDGNAEVLREIAQLLVNFEILYVEALDLEKRRWQEVYQLRSDKVPSDDQRTVAASKSVLTAQRNLWAVRLDFVHHLKALALQANIIDRHQAMQWEERFYARCCPRFFRPDRVDALGLHLSQLEDVPDDLDDVIAVLTEVLSEYRRERHTLRVQLSRAQIVLRNSWGERRKQFEQRVSRLHNEVSRLESRTLSEITSLIDHRAPSSNDRSCAGAQNGSAPPQR